MPLITMKYAYVLQADLLIDTDIEVHNIAYLRTKECASKTEVYAQ